MQNVQNFNLFGEHGDLPDVVHCEEIETRSVIHDWEFKPHRHAGLHQFLLLDTGGGGATLDDTSHELFSGCLVNIPTGVVHSFAFEPGTTGWVVTVSRVVLDDYLQESEGLNPVLSNPDVLRFSSRIRGIVQNLFAEYANLNFARAHILRSMSGVLAGLVARSMTELGHDPVQLETSLQRRFEAMLEENFRQHLRVSDYAEKLAVTSTHLSRVLRQTTGRSTSAIIEDRLVREARRFLAYSNLSAAEIAYQLGYVDPAYFSRVFKRATGYSPRAFRQNLEGQSQLKERSI